MKQPDHNPFPWRKAPIDYEPLFDAFGVALIIGGIAAVTPRLSASPSYQPSLWLFIIPFSLGIVFMIIAWILRLRKKKKKK